MATSYAYVGAPTFIAAVEGRLAEAGFVRAADSASADIVLTYCTSASALEDLYFGDDGLVTSVAPGSVLVDLSATTPNFAREINAVATVNDLVMVEAPVTVRSLVAEDAFACDNLLGPVASEAEIPPAVRALLEALFGEVVEVGAPGRAQLMRNTHTLPLAAALVSAIEATALDDAAARSVGALDADQVPLFSPVSADPVVRAVRQKRFTGDYTAEMLLAELSAALMAADDAEVILPAWRRPCTCWSFWRSSGVPIWRRRRLRSCIATRRPGPRRASTGPVPSRPTAAGTTTTMGTTRTGMPSTMPTGTTRPTTTASTTAPTSCDSFESGAMGAPDSAALSL